jgi:hypothetical protein
MSIASAATTLMSNSVSVTGIGIQGAITLQLTRTAAIIMMMRPMLLSSPESFVERFKRIVPLGLSAWPDGSGAPRAGVDSSGESRTTCSSARVPRRPCGAPVHEGTRPKAGRPGEAAENAEKDASRGCHGLTPVANRGESWISLLCGGNKLGRSGFRNMPRTLLRRRGGRTCNSFIGSTGLETALGRHDQSLGRRLIDTADDPVKLTRVLFPQVNQRVFHFLVPERLGGLLEHIDGDQAFVGKQP